VELIKPDVAGLAACRALQTGVKPSHTHVLVGILCDQGVQRLRQGGGPSCFSTVTVQPSVLLLIHSTSAG
jgi:hypothetical protein